MSVVDEDRGRLLQHCLERGDSTISLDRCAIYSQVVKALVKSHGITDDDPERAVKEALEKLEALSLRSTYSEAGPIADNARHGIGEVRDS